MWIWLSSSTKHTSLPPSTARGLGHTLVHPSLFFQRFYETRDVSSSCCSAVKLTDTILHVKLWSLSGCNRQTPKLQVNWLTLLAWGMTCSQQLCWHHRPLSFQPVNLSLSLLSWAPPPHHSLLCPPSQNVSLLIAYRCLLASSVYIWSAVTLLLRLIIVRVQIIGGHAGTMCVLTCFVIAQRTEACKLSYSDL